LPVTLCPNCGVALAYEGQRHCAACGADLSAAVAAPARPAQAATVPPAAVAWQPTHRASMFGQPAWDQPDASSQPAVMLPAGLDLVLTQTYGYWAQVQAENGWHGWVDSQQLVAVPLLGQQWMAPATAKRGKTLLVLGAVALVVLLVGAGLLAFVAANAKSVPVDGSWVGIESGVSTGKLLVEFQVSGGQAGQVKIAFWDSSDLFYEWVCADSSVKDGSFTAENCLSQYGSDTLTIDVNGRFTSTREIDGKYSVTVNGAPYSGDWYASPSST
jgi:hypothetical protein